MNRTMLIAGGIAAGVTPPVRIFAWRSCAAKRRKQRRVISVIAVVGQFDEQRELVASAATDPFDVARSRELPLERIDDRQAAVHSVELARLLDVTLRVRSEERREPPSIALARERRACRREFVEPRDRHDEPPEHPCVGIVSIGGEVADGRGHVERCGRKQPRVVDDAAEQRPQRAHFRSFFRVFTIVPRHFGEPQWHA